MGLRLFRFKEDGERITHPSSYRGGGLLFSPRMLIAACFLLYTASMTAKGVFLAEIAYLMEVFAVDKATASLANTYYFVAYAGVQVLLFFLVKRMNLQKFLVITVPIAATSTAAMGLSREITDMYLLFAVCGVFQASVYGGCNSALTTYLPSRYLALANSVMNFGYAAGTVIAFVTSAVCVRFGLWRVPFFIAGVLSLVTTALYGIVLRKAPLIRSKLGAGDPIEGKKELPKTERPFITLGSTRRKVLFYTVDLVMVFLITTLYYAVNNWISTLLVDVHSVSQDISIYITILAPTLIALGPVMTIRYCDRHRDFVRAGVIFLLVALPIPLLLAFFYGSSIIFSFVLSVIYIITVNGVKAVVLSVMAFKLRDVVNTAEYSLISNATASLAAGIAPTVFGKIIDSYGWGVYYFTTFGTTLFVVIFLIFLDLAVRRVDLDVNKSLPKR